MCRKEPSSPTLSQYVSFFSGPHTWQIIVRHADRAMENLVNRKNILNGSRNTLDSPAWHAHGGEEERCSSKCFYFQAAPLVLCGPETVLQRRHPQFCESVLLGSFVDLLQCEFQTTNPNQRLNWNPV